MYENFNRFKTIDTSSIKAIHQYTVEILSQRGVWVESERARDIYKAHGCQIDGKMVKINEKLLNQAIESLPESFDITPIDPQFKQTFGGDNASFGFQGGATYIAEPDGSRRVSTLNDTHDFFKLAQCFDVITVNNKIAWPLDVPTEHQHLMLTYSQIINNDKIWNPTMFTIDLVCMALGITPEKIKSDAERGLHHFYCGVNPVSPLEHTTLQTDYTIFYAEYGIPSIVSAMPIGGISAPASVEAVILQNNIEVLSSMVLSYLVNPKAPVIYGAIGTVGNMKTGGAPVAPPESKIIEAASIALARYYKLPSRANMGYNDSYTCDFECGAESALQAYNVIRSGANMITGIGDVASIACSSKEKVILDVELIGYINRIMKPLNFSREKAAVSLIADTSPQDTYLTNQHTIKNFRKEFYQPLIFQNNSYDKWLDGGKQDVAERASKKVDTLLTQFKAPDRDPAILKDLKKHVEKALGNTLVH